METETHWYIIYMPHGVKNNNFLDDCDFLFLNDAFSINKKSFFKKYIQNIFISLYYLNGSDKFPQ